MYEKQSSQTLVRLFVHTYADDPRFLRASQAHADRTNRVE